MTETKPLATVGVDGSDGSRHALDWAVRWALDAGGRLVLMSAEPVPARVMHMQGEVLQDLQNLVEQERGRVVEQHPELEVGTEPRLGHPSLELVQASGDSDLIVVGARGRGGFLGDDSYLGQLLGSVAQGVAADAACPVVVLPDPGEFAADGPVLVCADGSTESAAAAQFAFELAQRRGLAVRALHAWESPFAWSPRFVPAPPPSKEQINAEGTQAITDTIAAAATAYPDVEVEQVVEPGYPADVIARGSSGASLVVLGSRGLGRVQSVLLGSVSRGVLHRAKVPVAVRKSPDDEAD